MQKNWYTIKDIDLIDSPALVVYPQRVKENIGILKSMIDDVNRLRPHVKTYKSAEVSKLLLEAGIRKFKCATIAEAEMLAMSGASDILLAYQPTSSKAERFISLIKKYSDVAFSCLVDNLASAKMLAESAIKHKVQFHVYIDINVGMNRTGMEPGNEVIQLYKSWYFVRPIVSVICGAVSYLFLKAGLLILEAKKESDATNFGFFALAFIAGMNVDKFISKIEDLAQATWGIEKSRSAKPQKEND